MKNNYSALDDVGYATPAAFVFPLIPCGHYTAKLPTGEDVHFKFRRMPRAQRHTGRFGVFAKDEDAGDVLIAIMTTEGTGFEYVNGSATTYPTYTQTWEKVYRNQIPYQMTKTQCAWCGRDLVGSMVEGKVHDKCLDKII